jgi:hypothetical protein
MGAVQAASAKRAGAYQFGAAPWGGAANLGCSRLLGGLFASETSLGFAITTSDSVVEREPPRKAAAAKIGCPHVAAPKTDKAPPTGCQPFELLDGRGAAENRGEHAQPVDSVEAGERVRPRSSPARSSRAFGCEADSFPESGHFLVGWPACQPLVLRLTALTYRCKHLDPAPGSAPFLPFLAKPCNLAICRCAFPFEAKRRSFNAGHDSTACWLTST